MLRQAASIASTSGPSTPPVPCGESWLTGFVKYSSNHGPRTPYPDGSSIRVTLVPAVGVRGTVVSVDGSVGTFPQAESKRLTTHKFNRTRDGFIPVLIR